MSAHVFGTPANPATGAGNLRLTGINTDRRKGFALIDINGKVQAFMRGETLPDGRRITDITADGLILERGGKQESLHLAQSH